MIQRYQWVVVLAVALLLHVSALFLFFGAETDGAVDKGESGIEIGIGLLGDFGESLQVEEAESIEPEPELEPEPEPELEPEPEPEPELIQEPDVALEKEEVEDEPVVPDPFEDIKNELRPEVTEQAVTEPAKQPAKRLVTTGSGSSMSTGGELGARQTYNALIAATLARNKRYPISSRRRGEEGVATLYFIVDKDGRVIERSIRQSAGHKRLDRAVLKMLKKAEPFPRFLPGMDTADIAFSIPVGFRLKDQK